MKENGIIFRIKELQSFYGLTQVAMSAKLGIDQANLSSILSGKRPCGKGMIDKLILSFPAVNDKWLLNGEGEMLKVSQSMGDVNNSLVVGANFSGNGNNITHNDSINEMIGLLKKKDEQIDRLLTIIEKMGK